MDADTSSFPKPPLPVSPFDVANQYGALAQRAQSLQSGQLTIERQKLENAGLALTHMMQGLNSLGSNPSKSDIIGLGNNMVKMGLVPESMMDAMDSQIPDDPKFMPQFVDRLRTQAATHQEMINYFLGQPGFVQNGQQVIPIRSPESGATPVITGQPIQQQPGPQLPTVNTQPGPNRGQPGYVGPQPSTAPPVGPLGGENPLPIAPQPSAVQPSMGTVSPSVSPPASPMMGPSSKDQGRVVAGTPIPGNQQPGFIPSGMPPMFDEGRKALVADQDLATKNMTAIKPIIEAINLMKGLKFGPGTEAYNTALAGLNNLGILSKNVTDSNSAYQEVTKLLHQYVASKGSRSDADLQNIEASNPNPQIQIAPALLKIAKDQVARDVIESSRPVGWYNADDGKNGNLQNYNKFRSSFPQSMDQNAFVAKFFPGDDANSIIKQMRAKSNSDNKNDKDAAEKFRRSYGIAQQMFNPSIQ